MPELPEVETVKNVLKHDLIGKKIKSIDVYYDKIIKNVSSLEFCDKLKGETFKNINRIGKHLIFETEHYYVVAHLRMEGKYFLMHDEELSKHDHIVFNFVDGSNLRYNDVRKFGTIHLYSKDDYKCIDNLRDVYPLNKVGLEPFDEKMNILYLKEKFKSIKSAPIKSILLDQSIIAGLGNIYVDEVLYLSHIHPEEKVNNLSDEDLKLIIDSSIEVLNKAIKLGGTTIRSFQSSHEISGRFQNELNVHTKDVCPLGHEIIKIRVGGRGTYLCPICQKYKKGREEK